MAANGKPKVEISVEVTSDIVCPWCFIGRVYLESAMKVLEKEADFKVSWRPFLLDANCPAEGIPFEVYMTNKHGEKVAHLEMKGQGPIAKAGKTAGIKFDTERYIVNSVKAHLLMEYVLLKHGPKKQSALQEVLFRQYFEEAVNLNSERVLAKIAEEQGIDKDEAVAFFSSPANVKHLFAEIAKSKKKGILGVPYFSVYIDGFNEKRPVTFSGSQSKAGFVETFQKLIKEFQKANK